MSTNSSNAPLADDGNLLPATQVSIKPYEFTLAALPAHEVKRISQAFIRLIMAEPTSTKEKDTHAAPATNRKGVHLRQNRSAGKSNYTASSPHDNG
jgi:hypothetical protein